MEAFQAGGGVCGRETPSGENTGILAFADHLHARKPLEHTTGEGNPQKAKSGLFSTPTIFDIIIGSLNIP